MRAFVGAAAAAALLGSASPALGKSPPHALSHDPVHTYELDLDKAPEDRYAALLPEFNKTVWAFWDGYFAKDFALRDALYALTKKRGPEKDAEQWAEIQGLAKLSGLPLEFVHGVQMIYELQTTMVPEVNFTAHRDLSAVPAAYRPLLERLPWRGPGCTGIIAHDRSDGGSVWHARNLDFAPVSVFRPLIYNAVFKKGGKELFQAQMVAGYTMVVTGVRWDTDNGYSIERNTRYTDHLGGDREMFKHLESGRTLNGWSLRKVLEEQAEYEAAVKAVSEAPFVSTEYTIMSGVQKGTILAKGPDSVAHQQVLGGKDKGDGADYIIITNFDFFWHDAREYFDPTGGGGFWINPTRRQAAQKLLDNATAKLDKDTLFQVINAPYVLADTVFQAVINVEKRVWNISIPALAAKAAGSGKAETILI